MFGWYLGSFLIILFIFWRTKKKYFTILSNLSSRISQVEELLLEICAVLETQNPLDEVSSETTESIVKEESKSSEASILFTPQNLEEKLPARANNVTDAKPIMNNSLKQKKETEKTGNFFKLKKEQQKIDKPEPDQQESSPQKALTVKTINSKETTAHIEQEMPERESKVTIGQGTVKKARENMELLNVPERHQTIIRLFQKGLSVKEIARQSGMGQGEVQLIIDLYVQQD